MQQKVRFRIGGMTCQACAVRLEKVLNKKDFVQTASVNFAGEEAQVVFDGSRTDKAALAGIIAKAGFEAVEETGAAERPSENRADRRLWLLLALCVPFAAGMAGMMAGRREWMMPPVWQFALASVVQLWLAVPFYKSAWAGIKGGTANMDVLVSTGTAAIYLYSAAMMFLHGGEAHVYFEAGVMVVGFVSLGKFLERRVKRSGLDSIGLLLRLTPGRVSVARDGQWLNLPPDQVRTGDLIRAVHGGRIAADGTVESGSGWTDESHLTGESAPEAKTAGAKVLAGALVTDGSFVYRADRLGRETRLGDMMAALAEAQGSKAPIARVADKAAAVFVPAVGIVAALTFLLTWAAKGSGETALMNAVAVLVIACPCALGLATPAAIMAGMGRAARHGVLFKDAAAMEAAARVDTVVLDKTGTLTEGRPEVAAVWVGPSENWGGAASGADGADAENRLYRLAAAVGLHAGHPLARAIVQAALARGITPPEARNVQSEAGAGVQAELEGAGEVKIGKPAYCGFALPEQPDPVWRRASIVAVSANGRALGAFALADRPRADSRQAVGRLKAHGIGVYMMSGDNPDAAAHTAAQLGIDRALGGMSPRGKAEEVQKLQAAGRTVAMVGDGINDAPALAAADVGFAMKDGAEAAEHTASATLMQHSVAQTADALLIARATLKNIKQNLFFAFFYNVLCIPLAALGYLNPVIAGAAMALSSVSVLANALRLKRVKIG